MDNGYVIIGIIALLFLSMYGYVYASIAFENIKGKKAKKKLVKLRELELNKDLREQSRNEKLKLVQMKNQINEKQAG